MCCYGFRIEAVRIFRGFVDRLNLSDAVFSAMPACSGSPMTIGNDSMSSAEWPQSGTRHRASSVGIRSGPARLVGCREPASQTRLCDVAQLSP
jgi:hypothetical protein